MPTPGRKFGPLVGLRVVELAGIGPGPHAAMLLSDLGAEVARIQRKGTIPPADSVQDQQLRGRLIVEADLKDPDNREVVLDLVARADILIEGFRPGVAERLGLGPDSCASRNPRLIYGRMTGWGQHGPWADRAGHDINYLSVTGLLHAIGREGERPIPPLNLAADFGGGSMFLVVGILAALAERSVSGQGQTVDAAMVDGAPVLGHMTWAQRGLGEWSDTRGTNYLDTGAPFYDTYVCADGEYVAVGALEPQFYAQLVNGLGLDMSSLPAQSDRSGWPMLREVFTAAFAERTRDEWAAVFFDSDACVTPVLTFGEVSSHPHMAQRQTILDLDGVEQPGPAPRFSRTPPGAPEPPPRESVAAADLWI